LSVDDWKPLEGYTPRVNGRLKLLVAASHRYLKNLKGLVEALSLLSVEDRERIVVEWYGDQQEWLSERRSEQDRGIGARRSSVILSCHKPDQKENAGYRCGGTVQLVRRVSECHL